MPMKHDQSFDPEELDGYRRKIDEIVPLIRAHADEAERNARL